MYNFAKNYQDRGSNNDLPCVIEGVIYFTNHNFIIDWFVHTGVITYK